MLTPAQRTDLWVDFSASAPARVSNSDSPTHSSRAGWAWGGGMGMVSSTDTTLALDGEVAVTFVVADGDPTPGTRPTSLSEIPSIIEQAVNPDSPKVFELSTFRAAHWINDAQWEGRTATELETVKAGSVERWEFVNRSPLPHPMHLHGRHFEVVSRTWDDDTAATSWGQIEAGIIDAGRRDTVLVWPGQRVQIAVPFGEHLGYFMYHCHILEHEDAGMMRNFHVT
ncbi:MAG: multicopper oxidase domain-containing protein [Acidimicrobiales bacterium]